MVYTKKITDFSNTHIDALRLIRTPNIGSVTFKQLISLYKNPTQVLKVLPQLMDKKGHHAIQIPSKKQAVQELEDIIEFGGFTSFYFDKDYPPYLKLCPDSPIVLHGMGEHHYLFNPRTFGIVGSRQASAVARKWTYNIAKELGEKQYVIVSGAAIGIDRAAHKGGLSKGTIGIIACGLDKVYPAYNQDLYHVIKKHGCLLTEYPLGTEPLAQHFPRRNRIIAGLSLGILLVEASLHSGSLITARYALNYGREVFAMPGAPYDKRVEGSNKLIKDGAYLVEDIDDILNIMTKDSHFSMPNLSFQINQSDTMFDDSMDEQINNISTSISKNDEDDVLQLLNYQGISLDTLLQVSNLKQNILLLILLKLELQGKIERTFDGKYLRIHS